MRGLNIKPLVKRPEEDGYKPSPDQLILTWRYEDEATLPANSRFERVHMGIGYPTPADRFFNAAWQVEKAINLSAEDGLNFYLTGKIEGQPERAVKDKSGQITVYLAGHPVKVLSNLTELKRALLPG